MALTDPDIRPACRRRPRIWLRWLLAVWGIYALAAGLFLNTALADWAINRHPDRFALTWTAAVSLYPGHVLAWGVQARGHARQVSWQASASSAHATIAWLPLLRRELQLPWLRVHQVDFQAGRVQHDMPPRTRSDHAWTVALPNIQTRSLQQARWQSLRLQGPARVRFGLRKGLRGGSLTVFPSSLDARNARLQWGEDILLDGLKVQLGFALPEHLASEYPGLKRLPLMQATAKLDGIASGVQVQPAAVSGQTISVMPGDGRLVAELSLAQGVLQPGSRVKVDTPMVIELLQGEAHADRLHVEVGVDHDLYLRAALAAAQGRSARLDADLRVAWHDMTLSSWREWLPHTSGRLALRWRFDSLRWLSQILVRSDWLTFDGHGELDVDLRIEQGHLVQGSHFEVPNAGFVVRALNNRISGSTHATGRIHGENGAMRAQVELVAEQFSMAPDDALDAPYVQGRDLRITLDSPGELARFHDEAKARIRFDQAQVPDLRHYNRYLPGQTLRFTGGRGTLTGDMNVNVDGHLADGRIDIRARNADLAVADLELRGDVNIEGRIARADLDDHRIVLDGSRIELSRMAFGDRKAVQRLDWWARIELPSARADWRRPLALDGEASIVMKDIGFLLALFERSKPFPRWVSRLVDSGQTQVYGQAQVRGRQVVLDRMRARNDRLELNARLRLAEGQAYGDLLVGWRALALGVELAPDDRDYHVLRPRAWYESRPDFLPP